MALPQPREGESEGFRLYPDITGITTLGDPEDVTWASIRQLCSRALAEGIAEDTFGIRRKRDREDIATNVRIYIQQATEFYEAARSARSSTAPLLHYYSFLHLAKAICEFKNPRLHARRESYRHGLSWRPDPQYTVDMERESISLTTRGIWHMLWETLTATPLRVPNPTRLRVKDLFACCPEISIEFERAYGTPSNLIELIYPDILSDARGRQFWIRFSIERAELKRRRLTAPTLLHFIQSDRSGYIEVKSPHPELRTFESITPLEANKTTPAYTIVETDVAAFNAFASLDAEDGVTYNVAPQMRFPFKIPQIAISYSILFWLGSLVRYDPHSLSRLMDSQYWIVIDGFMTQSRLWLLELFEWALYQQETTLTLAR